MSATGNVSLPDNDIRDIIVRLLKQHGGKINSRELGKALQSVSFRK